MQGAPHGAPNKSGAGLRVRPFSFVLSYTADALSVPAGVAKLADAQDLKS